MGQGQRRSGGFHHHPQRDRWIKRYAAFSQVVLGFLEALTHRLDLFVGRDHRHHDPQRAVVTGAQKRLKLSEQKIAVIEQYPYSTPADLWIAFWGKGKTSKGFVGSDVYAAECHFVGGDGFDDLSIQGKLCVFIGPRGCTKKKKLCPKKTHAFDPLGRKLFVVCDLGQQTQIGAQGDPLATGRHRVGGMACGECACDLVRGMACGECACELVGGMACGGCTCDLVGGIVCVGWYRGCDGSLHRCMCGVGFDPEVACVAVECDKHIGLDEMVKSLKSRDIGDFHGVCQDSDVAGDAAFFGEDTFDASFCDLRQDGGIDLMPYKDHVVVRGQVWGRDFLAEGGKYAPSDIAQIDDAFAHQRRRHRQKEGFAMSYRQLKGGFGAVSLGDRVVEGGQKGIVFEEGRLCIKDRGFLHTQSSGESGLGLLECG